MAKSSSAKTPSSAKTAVEIKKIEASNEAYYKALSGRDMPAMEKVWTCAADNILIAPPGNPPHRTAWESARACRLVGN